MSKKVRKEAQTTLTGKISYAHNIKVMQYLEENNLNRSEYLRMASERMLESKDNESLRNEQLNLIAHIVFITVSHISGISESEKLEVKKECFSELSKLGALNV